MKKLILFIACISSLQVFSQKQDKSNSFDQPLGWCKLVQLKNNNTFFVEFTKKEGIKIMLFDANRKKISSEKLPLNLIKDILGYYTVSGIYEISGDIAIFYQTAEERTPILIRILIDGNTGKLKSEEKIAALNSIEKGSGYAAMFGDVENPDIKIEKDPESDYYAIILYNTLAAETNDRIEVIHYNPQHKEINKAKYSAPDNKYKYTRYLSAYVHKEDYVVIGTYAYNTKKSGGEDARFYVSQLAKGKTSFTQKELVYKDFWKAARCNFVYNKVKGIINMVLITDVDMKGNDKKYDIVYQNINPLTLQLEKPYYADFSKINDYYKSTMERKTDFEGMVQGTVIDKDGNLIVLYQNTELYPCNDGGICGTNLGDVALITMAPDGKVINSIPFSASIYARGKHARFNCNDIRNGYRPLDPTGSDVLADHQNFAMDMVTTDNSCYIFFNNMTINMDLPESKKPKQVISTPLISTVKYTYSKNIIKKEYLLGEPKDKKDNEFCNISCSDYNASTKTYATISTDPKTKQSKVLWLSLD